MQRGSSQDEAATDSSNRQQNVQQPEQEGVQVAMLRSMSNTRLAKFNRLLGEQVGVFEVVQGTPQSRPQLFTGLPNHCRSSTWRRCGS